MDRFFVVLDNPVGVYFPGQTLTGKVIVKIEKPTPLNGIFIEFKGGAHVWFSQQKGKHRATYSSSEEYFDSRVALLQQNGDTFKLDAGEYEYLFALILPDELPSSYESRNGHVRYSVRATLERSWRTSFECKMAFTVNSIMDLNTVPEARMSTEATNTKTLGIAPFASKPITAKAWLSRMGYIPGETILFCGHVDNLTGKPLKGSKVRLVEITEYYARNQKYLTTRIISEQATGPVGDAMDWDHVPIVVPPVPPSGLRFCNIILVSYRIQLIVDPRTLSGNLVTAINIVIGNVPLSMSSHQLPGAPPNYEESVFGIEAQDPKERDQGADMKFTPRYPVYLKTGN